MLTSESSQVETYPASTNLFPLSRDWSDRAGKMSTVCTVYRTGWWSFSIVDPGVRWPSATVKILVDGWPVCMKVSPTMLTLEMHTVS